MNKAVGDAGLDKHRCTLIETISMMVKSSMEFFERHLCKTSNEIREVSRLFELVIVSVKIAKDIMTNSRQVRSEDFDTVYSLTDQLTVCYATCQSVDERKHVTEAILGIGRNIAHLTTKGTNQPKF